MHDFIPEFIPKSEDPTQAQVSPERFEKYRELAWGGGDLRKTINEMTEVSHEMTGRWGLPEPNIAPLRGTGPTGERHEHDKDYMEMRKAVKRVAILWATAKIPQHMSWTNNTKLTWLRKVKSMTGVEDDALWLWNMQDPAT